MSAPCKFCNSTPAAGYNLIQHIKNSILDLLPNSEMSNFFLNKSGWFLIWVVVCFQSIFPFIFSNFWWKFFFFSRKHCHLLIKWPSYPLNKNSYGISTILHLILFPTGPFSYTPKKYVHHKVIMLIIDIFVCLCKLNKILRNFLSSQKAKTYVWL